MRLEEIICIDFEASGLAPDSWPVEIGLAWVDMSCPTGPMLRKWSALIRPEADWCEALWDPVAQELHGIDLARLKAKGRPA